MTRDRAFAAVQAHGESKQNLLKRLLPPGRKLRGNRLTFDFSPQLRRYSKGAAPPARRLEGWPRTPACGRFYSAALLSALASRVATTTLMASSTRSRA